MTDHTYTLREAKNRLNFLDIIHSFLFEDIEVIVRNESEFRKREILTIGEKICISQERAALRDFISYNNGEIDEKEVRNYKVSPIIESKIEACVSIIKQTNWLKTYQPNY